MYISSKALISYQTKYQTEVMPIKKKPYKFMNLIAENRVILLQPQHPHKMSTQNVPVPPLSLLKSTNRTSRRVSDSSKTNSLQPNKLKTFVPQNQATFDGEING